MHVIVMCEPGRRGQAAVDEAAALARRHEARLTLAALIDLPDSDRGCLSWSAWRDLMVAEAREQLDTLAWKIGLPDADRAVLVGPGMALTRLEALECDLLVLPARPRLSSFRRDPYAVLRGSRFTASFPVAEPRRFSAAER